MSTWLSALEAILRDGLIVVAVWAITVVSLGAFLTRPRRTRRHVSPPPAEDRPLTRDDFTLAA